MLLNAALLLLPLIQISLALNPISMSDCLLYPSQIHLPNENSSIVERRQLPASSQPTVADCALTCLQLGICRAAVFNAATNMCSMSYETVESTGQLVAAPSSDFTTISIQERLGRIKADFVD
jgi:hypothetical protein